MAGAGGAGGCVAGGSYQLPKVLLTPAAAAADVGLRDVYEYLSTQVRLSLLLLMLNALLSSAFVLLVMNCRPAAAAGYGAV
jgi:hypothetical protein